jgi:sugar phosphate isomerase/epimerase
VSGVGCREIFRHGFHFVEHLIDEVFDSVLDEVGLRSPNRQVFRLAIHARIEDPPAEQKGAAMEIAGYSYTWGPVTRPREIDYPKLFQWYRDRDITTIELYDPWIEDKDDDHVKMIIDSLGEYGMDPRLCDVNCHVVSRDADERKRGAARFHDRLRVMNRIGIKIALILPFLPGYETDFTPGECQEWLNSALEESLPLAKELGITLMIANLGFRGDIYGQAEWVVDACKALPDIRMVYDVGNFVMAGVDPVIALDLVFSYMIHVHFKDWVTYDSEEVAGEMWLGHGDKWYQGCKFGEGIVNQKAAAIRLKELGYDGFVSPEYEGPGDPYEYMDQAIGYSRELIG